MGKNQMSMTSLEAHNIKIITVLSDFAKCWGLHLKSAPQVPKIEGGGEGGGLAKSGNAI